jgi:hypothetical protein
MRHEDNNVLAVRCAELQYRFLMSSDLYETPGLISMFIFRPWLISDPLIGTIIEMLHRPGNTRSNGVVNGEISSSGDLHAFRNALEVISRLPLEPITPSLRDSVFTELISLDRALIYRLVPQLADHPMEVDVLTSTRRALVRLIEPVSRDVITDESVVDTLFEQFKSLDKFPSPELRSVTLALGTALLTRLSASSSHRATHALQTLVHTLIRKTSYELQCLRPSLHSWLQLPTTPYFVPKGEALLGILAIEQLGGTDDRSAKYGRRDLEELKVGAFVQLRDCLVDLLEPAKVDGALVQGVYLFEKMRRLLLDSGTEFSVHGLTSLLAY